MIFYETETTISPDRDYSGLKGLKYFNELLLHRYQVSQSIVRIKLFILFYHENGVNIFFKVNTLMLIIYYCIYIHNIHKF